MEMLRLELQAREAAETERRMEIWETKRVTSHAWSIRLLAAEAHNVEVNTGSPSVSASRWQGASGTMFRKDLLIVEFNGTNVDDWDRRVIVSWSESGDLDSAVFQKPLTL